MPLDPNKFYHKRRTSRPEILLAVEWSAIIFAGMLAMLFFAWALALQLPESGIFTADEASQPQSLSAPVLQ